MTYEEIFEIVQDVYENADARDIFEHIAVQINIEGEGSGAFYIEVAQREICVEPYDYHDRDGLVTASGETLCAIARQEMTAQEAMKQDLIKIEGNMHKLFLLENIKLPKRKQ